MAVQHTNFVLKVLNGINSGAMVRLKTGSLVIGSAMSSDIILYDENIADQHVQLLVTPGGVTLQPLAQPVFVDGNEVTSEGVELRAPQLVRLGGIELVVSDERQLAGKSSAAGAKSKKPTQSAARRPQTATGKRKRPPSQPLGRQQDARRKKRSVSGKALLGVGLGILLVANLVFFLPRMNGLLEQVGLRPPVEEKAAQLLADLGQQNFKVEEGVSGSPVLKGYTQTVAERNELLSRIRSAGLRADMQIWANEEIVENAAIIASSLGEPGIEIRAGKTPGELQASGFVSDPKVWDRVNATILSDIGGIRSIDAGNLRTVDEYMASFMQFIEKNGLSSRPELTVADGRVIVSGELTKTEIEKLESLRQKFIELHGDGPTIVMNVINVHERIELAIRSVSVGDVPFLVSKDGKKYMEGSALGESYFVKTIKPDHVVLTNNGMDIPFYYGIEEENNDAAN